MTPLFGHEQAIAAFREGMDSGRMHHAWLISGPVGIGKALFVEPPVPAPPGPQV